MKLNTVLKYYLLTVIASAILPYSVFRVNIDPFGRNIDSIKKIALMIGIIAAANLPHFLLLIKKTSFKAKLTIVPFATVIPAIALYCFFLPDPREFASSYTDRRVASVISTALNIFVLIYAYEKILASRAKEV